MLKRVVIIAVAFLWLVPFRGSACKWYFNMVNDPHKQARCYAVFGKSIKIVKQLDDSRALADIYMPSNGRRVVVLIEPYCDIEPSALYRLTYKGVYRDKKNTKGLIARFGIRKVGDLGGHLDKPQRFVVCTRKDSYCRCGYFSRLLPAVDGNLEVEKYIKRGEGEFIRVDYKIGLRDVCLIMGIHSSGCNILFRDPSIDNTSLKNLKYTYCD
ncbi:hypothetical protein [Hippea sp. KM1]|uniref:hypothetical protein n=1 Tax=Hippea sp. KM1 TaxID=944481 RepID=UPI0012EB4DC5|nr:hypothetical protein [Hippea sp. KM1]